MKFTVCISLLVCSFIAKAQKFSDVYKPGSQLYVHSKEGISLRQKPDASAAKIMVIPFGTSVKVLADAGPRVSFESTGVRGTWAKVLAAGKEGYVFDGFISRFKPVEIPAESGFTVRQHEAFARLLKGSFQVKTESKDEDPVSYKWDITFTNGVEFSAMYNSILTVKFPFGVITYQELFLMARSAYPVIFSDCGAYQENYMICTIDFVSVRIETYKDPYNYFQISFSAGD